jgi:hypothetical protein
MPYASVEGRLACNFVQTVQRPRDRRTTGHDLPDCVDRAAGRIRPRQGSAGGAVETMPTAKYAGPVAGHVLDAGAVAGGAPFPEGRNRLLRRRH